GSPTSSPTSPVTTTVSNKVTISGTVYDRNNIVVDAATVTARSVETNVHYSKTVQSLNGTYLFSEVPVGARIEISVTKPDYKTVTRTVVPKENITGSATGNVYDFGGNSNKEFTLQKDCSLTITGTRSTIVNNTSQLSTE